MPAPAGYTQGQLGLYWKESDGSGPYALNNVGDMVLWDGSGSTPNTFSNVAITSVTTANPGSGWTAFDPAACVGLDIVNASGVDIEYRRGGAGSSFQLLDGMSRFIEGITDASDISVRRIDQSNTQVTLYAETFA